ncbi:hypothetical protein M8C21_001902 [Ambrosia artemisiifolia]|uniref:Beta-amylase n=1 Tax=Ambrosia artemisiifolia TaxID=4212 RepID=A0AAD5C256_AMBAR|nr:hypothetical protein M8C21_001902 [Ambrosia artemisiifolia]
MSNNNQDGSPNSQPPPQQHRRPRGFAASAMSITTNPRATRKEREKEKERTKLRERHRRAITSRMLAGLRQYGNFPLPARADMNDVLAALARDAGWTVQPDGTTFRHSHSSSKLGVYPGRSVESPLSSNSMKSYSMKPSLDFPSSVLRIDDSSSPASLDSVVIPEKYSVIPIDSNGCLETDQLMQEGHSVDHECNFIGTAYVPVYVMLGTGLINKFCQLIDRDAVRKELRLLKSLNVDGVFVECWWGIVESQGPQQYCWSGYRELFNIINEFELKVQVGLAFHEHGGNDSRGIPIPLPQWVLDIGKENKDIFFTDREGRSNPECLSWGIDKERVLKGRTAAEYLINHADVILSLATLAFEEIQIVVKIPSVYWWYKSTSHAAELTAGYYNSANQDGYSAIFEVLKKHLVTVKFVCSGLHLFSDGNQDALADPKGLTWQVLNSGWDTGLTLAGQNALIYYDKEVFMRLVETAKPINDPDHHHFAFFTFQPPLPLVENTSCFSELERFIGCMHGEMQGRKHDAMETIPNL